MTKKIFVYGSLMEDLFNHEKYLKGKVITRKYARTRGELYHLAQCGYPAMIHGEDYVYGELIEVLNYDNTLQELDKLEHYFGEDRIENEYNREIIKVQLLDNGDEEIANAYVYNCNDLLKLRNNNIYIKNGNWRVYLQQEKMKMKALA